jgi:hypothetical protein
VIALIEPEWPAPTRPRLLYCAKHGIVHHAWQGGKKGKWHCLDCIGELIASKLGEKFESKKPPQQ